MCFFAHGVGPIRAFCVKVLMNPWTRQVSTYLHRGEKLRPCLAPSRGPVALFVNGGRMDVENFPCRPHATFKHLRAGCAAAAAPGAARVLPFLCIARIIPEPGWMSI